MENNQKIPKRCIKALCNFFYEIAPLTHDNLICSKLWKDGENMLVSFCQTNILLNKLQSRT